MRLRRFWLILSALFIGCVSDRLAGTEVGNPELTVSARFGVRDTSDSMSVTRMNFKCMGMAYHSQSDTADTLWEIPGGYMVSMRGASADTDSLALRTVKIRSSAWDRAEMTLQSPTGDSSLPGAIAYGDFANPRYVKFTKRMDGIEHHFLFELAKGMEIKLTYQKAHIGSWIHNDSLVVEILFDAGKWASGLSLQPPLQIRKDSAGTDYLLLAPSENAGMYAALKTLLPQSFMADSTEMR